MPPLKMTNKKNKKVANSLVAMSSAAVWRFTRRGMSARGRRRIDLRSWKTPEGPGQSPISAGGSGVRLQPDTTENHEVRLKPDTTADPEVRLKPDTTNSRPAAVQLQPDRQLPETHPKAPRPLRPLRPPMFLRLPSLWRPQRSKNRKPLS
jgi:hypothetical protein